MSYKEPETDPNEGNLFIAGEVVPPGRYRLIGSGRMIDLPREEMLPATMDGRVACYQRIDCTWAVVRERATRSRPIHAA